MDLSRTHIKYVKKWTGGRNVGSKFLTEKEEAMRWECNNRKLSDADSAKVCGISVSSYCSWRNKRGLPIYESKRNGNRKGQANQRKDNKIINDLKKHVVLTAEDVVIYRHNDNTPRENNDKILISVAINGSEKIDLAPITAPLNKGLQPPKLHSNIIGFDHSNNKLRRHCTTETYRLKRCNHG